MSTLTETQIKAAEYLAAGMPHAEAAKRVGVTRVTVSRWNALADFKAEIDRRRQVAIAHHQQKAAELQTSEIDQFFEDLKEYRRVGLEESKRDARIALAGINKIMRRFIDLPDEAIAPSHIPALMNAFAAYKREAREEWAEVLGVEELIRRMEDNSKAPG